jgi:NhaC family Na+:H+ antiporter
MVLIIGVVVLGVRLGAGAHMSLFMGTIISILVAVFYKNKWADIQVSIIKVVSGCSVAILIIMITGIMIGCWILGGTVPSLLYYGLKVCTPQIIVPLAFVLCAITSVLTGTSFGSMATMGLALAGVGMGIGIPLHVMVGAVVAGSYFGDKMSPMSDTTNMAAGMSNVGLYSHIGSMLYTTVPATIICIIAYTFIGMRFSVGAMDTSSIGQLMNALSDKFWITPLSLIPPLCVLTVSALRLPAVPALGGCATVSAIFAMLLQKANFITVMRTAFSGYRSDTGTPMLDTLLSRGGLTMVSPTIMLIILACVMGGAILSSNIISVLLEDLLLKVIRKPSSLVLSTMIYCYTILALSGNQVLGIVMGGPAFSDAYDRLNLNRKVLSRTLEDTNTIFAPMIPWGAAAAYIVAVFGVDMGYIPYSLLAFIVPVFSILCAFTGFGMWTSGDVKYWKNKKAA